MSIETEPHPVLIRAELSEHELRELKKLAVDLGISFQRLVTLALQTAPRTRSAFQ